MAHTTWPYQYAGMNIQIILKFHLRCSLWGLFLKGRIHNISSGEPMRRDVFLMGLFLMEEQGVYLFFFERNDSLPCDVFYEDYLKDFWEFVCFGRSKINIRNNH